MKKNTRNFIIVILSIWTAGLISYHLFIDLDGLYDGTYWQANFEKSECGQERSFLWPWEAEVYIKDLDTNTPISCEYVTIRRSYDCEAGSDCFTSYLIIAKGFTTKSGSIVVPSAWRGKTINNINNNYRESRLPPMVEDGYVFRMTNYQLSASWMEEREGDLNTLYVTNKK